MKNFFTRNFFLTKIFFDYLQIKIFLTRKKILIRKLFSDQNFFKISPEVDKPKDKIKFKIGINEGVLANGRKK